MSSLGVEGEENRPTDEKSRNSPAPHTVRKQRHRSQRSYHNRGAAPSSSPSSSDGEHSTSSDGDDSSTPIPSDCSWLSDSADLNDTLIVGTMEEEDTEVKYNELGDSKNVTLH